MNGWAKLTLDWRSPQRSDATRVLLIGGSSSTRRALGEILTAGPTIALAGQASLHDAVEAAVQTRPDVVLMDVRLPDVTAVLASRTIRSNLQACQTLLLSTSADFRTVAAAVLSGASGHVLKSLDPTPLRNAIEAAGAGQMRLNRRIAPGLLDWFGQRAVTSAEGETHICRTAEDMLLLADITAGELDSSIALAIGCSVAEVQSKVARLHDALNADPGFRTTGNALARLLRVPGEHW